MQLLINLHRRRSNIFNSFKYGKNLRGSWIECSGLHCCHWVIRLLWWCCLKFKNIFSIKSLIRNTCFFLIKKNCTFSKKYLPLTCDRRGLDFAVLIALLSFLPRYRQNIHQVASRIGWQWSVVCRQLWNLVEWVKSLKPIFLILYIDVTILTYHKLLKIL